MLDIILYAISALGIFETNLNSSRARREEQGVVGYRAPQATSTRALFIVVALKL